MRKGTLKKPQELGMVVPDLSDQEDVFPVDFYSMYCSNSHNDIQNSKAHIVPQIMPVSNRPPPPEQ
jgi:hypothetical protein